MSNKRKTSIDCTHLLNFKTNIPFDLQSSASISSSSSSRRNHRKNYSQRKHDPKKQAAQREENWTRQKLQSSFYLHSSASHSFVLKRTPALPSKDSQLKARYLKLHGLTNKQNSNLADAVVDWDVVQTVKVQVPTSSSTNEAVDASISTCSICLSSFVAPRITKCGHIFCYPCILRHFHVSNGDNAMNLPSANAKVAPSNISRRRDSIAKCPCCSNYIYLSELRPVEFASVQAPFCRRSINKSMTFHKCHRKKGGLVPYLPFDIDGRCVRSRNNTNRNHNNPNSDQNESDKKMSLSIRKRDEPNDIPSVKSADAPYCRFNYMDVSAYIQNLQNDLTSLQHDMQSVIEMYSNLRGSMKSKGDVNGNLDRYFINMALEAVQAEHDGAVSWSNEQRILANEQESRYANLNKVKVLPFHAESNYNDQLSRIDEKKDRSNSNASFGNENKNEKKKATSRPRSNSMQLVPGMSYLDNDCVQFYQATDGQLCFLCGFNLKCLAYEFMDKDPARKVAVEEQQKSSDIGVAAAASAQNTDCRPPFPDTIHGQIIDIQTLHVTPEVRRRYPFTAHLPLYIDINLVEINLTQFLTQKTRDHFRSELDQRKKKRQAQKNSERKAKKKAEREEHERIERLKEGMQRIDVNDEFFHAPVIPATNQAEIFTGDTFGPSISSSQANADRSQSVSEVSYANSIHRSYGSVCASNGFFPQLDSSNDSAFPSLGSSLSNSNSSSSSPTQTKTRNSPKVVKSHSPWAAKSKKKDKVVLFSSGGRRGYA